ncbi:class I SAM-dependent methyltransferase, partial [Candidatus Woesearchaeota archaeon]|nr:class I SAM-dependent methyltransferase [Candidatus Woesearchaeota archaeon]
IVNALAENTGFGDNSFDFVFVNSVLHHVRNPLVVVDELIRIAAGNSFIVLVEPRRINPLIIAHSILKKHERGQLKLEFNKIKNHFKKSRFVNRIVEFPVNSLIYPYQNFPPKNIYPLICKFESVFRLRPISTHRALVVEIRK